MIHHKTGWHLLVAVHIRGSERRETAFCLLAFTLHGSVIYLVWGLLSQVLEPSFFKIQTQTECQTLSRNPVGRQCHIGTTASPID